MTQGDSFRDADEMRVVPSEAAAADLHGTPDTEARPADRDWRSDRADTRAANTMPRGVMQPSSASTGETTAQQAARASARETTPRHDGDESMDALRHDIERTRVEMGGTIDAIQERLGAVQERLKPQHLMNEAKDRVREATVGRIEDMAYQVEDRARDTGTSIVDTIKANPIPAALVAVGIGMLWRNRRSRHSSHRGGVYDDRIWDSRGNLIGYRSDPRLGMGGHRWQPERGPMENVQHQAGRWMGRAGETMGGMTGRAQDTMGSAAERVGEMAGDAASTAGDVASAAMSTAGDIASSTGRTVSQFADTTFDAAGNVVSGTGHQFQRAQSTLGRMLDENPLAVGAIAIGAGIAIGLALPETEREQEMLGEPRERLMEKAQEVFEDTKEKASRVASEARHAAMSEAQNQGLAPS